MWARFKAFLEAHPEMRSGIRVFVYTFFAGFSTSLFGFLADVQEWASGDAMSFPSVTVLGKAAASVLVSMLSGLLAYAYNKLPRTASAIYVTPPDVGVVIDVPDHPANGPEDVVDRGMFSNGVLAFGGVAILAVLVIVLWVR